MAMIYTVDATSTLDRPAMDGEYGRVTLPQRDYLGTRLHSGSLFGENELTPLKVFSRPRQ